MTGPERYREAERLMKATATSGPVISERDTWQQRQALVHAVLALAPAAGESSGSPLWAIPAAHDRAPGGGRGMRREARRVVFTSGAPQSAAAATVLARCWSQGHALACPHLPAVPLGGPRRP